MSVVLAELEKYAKELVNSGLVVGAGGNLSVRDGEFMYISPSGYDLKDIQINDWVKVHINTGEILSDLKPSSEILMHLVCFQKNPDINSVLHAHPTYSVAVSSANHEIPPMFPDYPAMIKNVAYIDYIIPTTELLANAVSNHVLSNEAIVLRNHGVITLGKTLKEAFFFMQILEEAAKVYLFSKLIGTPRILTDDECSDLKNLSSEKYRSNLLKE